MKPKLLILEDDLSLANSLAREFEDHNYDVSTYSSFKSMNDFNFDFAVIDIRLKGEFGLDAIDHLKKESPDCRIVILTGYGSIATAVEAVKRGAIDYLTKPASFKAIENALLNKRNAEDPEFKTQSLSQVEHEYIDFVLTKNQGNVTKTAKALGLHRQSLQRKLKKYT